MELPTIGALHLLSGALYSSTGPLPLSSAALNKITKTLHSITGPLNLLTPEPKAKAA